MPCSRDVAKGLAAGFFRYLTKPLKVDALMETLDVALAVADQGLFPLDHGDDCHDC